MSGIGATVLRLWQRLPRRRTLVDQYTQAAPRWHAAVRDLGYLAAYAELIASADTLLRRTQQMHPFSRALDLGTGTGAFALSVAGWHRAKLDLLDPSAAMLGIAARQLGEQGVMTEVICDSIEALAHAPRRYWLVICSHVLEHVADVQRALGMMRDVLEPGGVLLLVASRPHWCTALLQVRWRNESWDEHQMCEMLDAAGFQPAQTVRFRSGPPSRTSAGYITCRALDTDSTPGCSHPTADARRFPVAPSSRS
jgi:SAM-dependent methyltransferase